MFCRYVHVPGYSPTASSRVTTITIPSCLNQHQDGIQLPLASCDSKKKKPTVRIVGVVAEWWRPTNWIPAHNVTNQKRINDRTKMTEAASPQENPFEARELQSTDTRQHLQIPTHKAIWETSNAHIFANIGVPITIKRVLNWTSLITGNVSLKNQENWSFDRKLQFSRSGKGCQIANGGKSKVKFRRTDFVKLRNHAFSIQILDDSR